MNCPNFIYIDFLQIQVNLVNTYVCFNINDFHWQYNSAMKVQNKKQKL